MLFNVQVLRALAAYFVVIVHLDGVLESHGVPEAYLKFGGAGVDLFFVISGFVMVYTTALKPIGSIDFYINRLVRVAPMYWLMTLGVFVIALTAPSLLGATRAAPIDLVKSLLFVPYMKANGLIHPVLFVGWTLNYEMFFYLIFALSLTLRNLTLRVSLASAMIVALVAGLKLTGATGVFANFYGSTIMLEFVMGMWLAFAYLRGLRLPTGLAWLTLAAGLATLLSQGFLPSADRTLVCGIPSVLVLLSALSLEAANLVLDNRRVQLVGTASYALYLIHPFITQAATKLVSRVGALQGGLAVAIVVLLVFVAIGFAAILTHLLVERPLTRILRGAVGHAPSVVEREETVLQQQSNPA